MCKTNWMCKNIIWDLINISINRRDERGVQRVVLGMHTSCDMDDENMNVFVIFFYR